VVCGLGGAGKSQLVLDYVENFKDDYTATFWIDASSKERLEADYKQVHNLLLRPTRVDTAIDTCVSEIRHWCRSRGTRKYLFVLDSADSIDDEESPEYIDLQKYIVDATSADVVITTRVQSAKEMTALEAVQVAELTPDESREIFVRRLALVDPTLEVQKEIDEVTEELGHFALAVSLAAACVASTRRLMAHPAGYLLEYAERKKVLLARKPKKHIDQYGESVLTTWETSYAAMSRQCPEACNMLTFLSFLDSSNIFTELLHSSYEDASGILASMIFVPASGTSLQDTLDNGFQALELYSLLQWNDHHQTFSMHKLVQTWAFARLESDQQVKFCFAAWNYLERLCWGSRDLPAMERRLVSHVMACFVKVRALCHVESLATEDVVDMASSFATFVIGSGQFDFAYALQNFAHQHHERQHYVDATIHAASLRGLAWSFALQGKLDAAEHMLRQALDELDDPLSGEHVQIKEWCQLALVALPIFRDESLDEAEQKLRYLLEQQWQRNASESDKAPTMILLALIFARQGRHKEAEGLYKQLLESHREFSNPVRTVLTTEFCRALLHQGKIPEAEEVAQREIEHASIYSTRDSRSQMALMALGEVRIAQKAYAEAATLLEQACDATVTSNDLWDLTCQTTLGHALMHLRLYERALLTYTRVVDGYGRLLGGENRYTREGVIELEVLRASLAKSGTPVIKPTKVVTSPVHCDFMHRLLLLIIILNLIALVVVAT
jgi:tetratricopeptide (TPR) repeat protein